MYLTLHYLDVKLRYGDPDSGSEHWVACELLEPDPYLEKINFLITGNRDTNITGKLKPCIWTINVVYKSYLVTSTHLKINDLKWQYRTGRKFWSVYLTSCFKNQLGGTVKQQRDQPLGRMASSSDDMWRSMQLSNGNSEPSIKRTSSVQYAYRAYRVNIVTATDVTKWRVDLVL